MGLVRETGNPKSEIPKVIPCKQWWKILASVSSLIMRLGASTEYLQIYFHNENMSIQMYRKFYLQTIKIFRLKKSDIFHISAQNIDCRYLLELPHL